MQTRQDIEREVERQVEELLVGTGNRIGCPTPRLFTDAQRSREPLLAAEDSNPVFGAFARRRLHHSASWMNDFAGGLQSPAFVSGLILCLLPVVCLLVTFFGMKDSTLVTILVLSLSGQPLIAKPATSPTNTIPAASIGLFSVSGASTSLIVDLWMCGITGRDIAEAIYLDYRRQNLAFGIWPLPALLISMLLAAALMLGRSLASPLGLLLLCAVSISTTLYWYTIMTYSRPVGKVAELVDQWRSLAIACAKPGWSVTGTLTSFFRWEGSIYNLPWFVLLVLIVIYLKSAAFLPSPREVLMYRGTVSMIGASLVYFLLARMRVAHNERLLAKTIAEANSAFDEYVRVVLLGDHERR